MNTQRLVLAVAVLASLAWAWSVPFMLTDGDSCLFAAIGRDMTLEDWRGWIAPQWAYQGERAWFFEHPPGAFWLTGSLRALGCPDAAAPLLANTLWLWLLLGSLWFLAGRSTQGWLTVGLFLLHYPVLKYAYRAGLEIPFTASLVSALALHRVARPWAVGLCGACVAMAFLTRGIFAAVLPLLMGLDIWLRKPHRGWRRWFVSSFVAIFLLVIFDWLYQRATGTTFWLSYLEKQVFPSLQSDGTPHPNRGSTLLYYSGRLLIYTFPWCWIAVVLAWTNRQKQHLPKDIWLTCCWILLFFVGTVIARRQGSRYLFAVFPATAWCAALLLNSYWQAWPQIRREACSKVIALLPLLWIVLKTVFTKEDEWWQAAMQIRKTHEQLHIHGIDPDDAAIYGPFAPHDDRHKQFLRFHSGLWAFQEIGQVKPTKAYTWSSLENEFPQEKIFLHTPLGNLVEHKTND